MTRISTAPGEYAMWELDDVYPPEVIAKLAKDYGLDHSRLAEVLEEVVADFDDKAPYFYRVPIWHEAKEKALEVLRHLEDARNSLQLTLPETKAVMDGETLSSYSTDDLTSELNRMIVAVKAMANVFPREKGGNRTSTKSRGDNPDPIPDLTPFDTPSELLFDLWHQQKGKLMGHEVDYGHVRVVNGKELPSAVARSTGLAFLHHCLSRLDDRITVEQCRTRVRDIKAKLRGA